MRATGTLTKDGLQIAKTRLTSIDSMYVRGAHATAVNGNVHITVFHLLQWKLLAMLVGLEAIQGSARTNFLLLEVLPFLLILDHEAFSSLWVRHLALMSFLIMCLVRIVRC